MTDRCKTCGGVIVKCSICGGSTTYYKLPGLHLCNQDNGLCGRLLAYTIKGRTKGQVATRFSRSAMNQSGLSVGHKSLVAIKRMETIFEANFSGESSLRFLYTKWDESRRYNAGLLLDEGKGDDDG
jgi:hypothetical protein